VVRGGGVERGRMGNELGVEVGMHCGGCDMGGVGREWRGRWGRLRSGLEFLWWLMLGLMDG